MWGRSCCFTTGGSPGPPKPPQCMGEAVWLCPVVLPSPPPQDSEADLLVQKFSCRHGKGHMRDSRGLGGNGCALPSLAMQILLRNGAETAGLWGLVSKKKKRISFCSMLEGNNLNE